VQYKDKGKERVDSEKEVKVEKEKQKLKLDFSAFRSDEKIPIDSLDDFKAWKKQQDQDAVVDEESYVKQFLKTILEQMKLGKQPLLLSSRLWDDPEKKGFLIKQGHIRKNWKLRWFVLKGDRIWYFKSKNEMDEPLGEIELLDSIVSTTSDKITKDNCFELTCGSGKVFYIQATSKDVMDKWVEKINHGSKFWEVTDPESFQHPIHVDFTGDGFVGLPKEWEQWLNQGQFDESEKKKFS